MENEIWKDVEDYEGFYKISNLGNLKRLFGKVKSSSVNGGSRTVSEKIFRHSKGRWGYVELDICKYGVVKKIKVHRLVASAFIPNPENKPCVNHKNGVKTDNRVENLEWVTYSENFAHANKTGLRKQKFKLVLDFNTGVYYESLIEASIVSGICIGNLSSMLNGKRKNRTNFKYV